MEFATSCILPPHEKGNLCFITIFPNTGFCHLAVLPAGKYYNSPITRIKTNKAFTPFA